MQGMSYRIGRKESPSIGSIKNEMPRRKSFDTAAVPIEMFGECAGRRKPEMTRSVQRDCKGIRGHLFAELTASQDNEL